MFFFQINDRMSFCDYSACRKESCLFIIMFTIALFGVSFFTGIMAKLLSESNNNLLNVYLIVTAIGLGISLFGGLCYYVANRNNNLHLDTSVLQQ